MPGPASSRLVLRGALLLGVPLGGFLFGRALAPRAEMVVAKPQAVVVEGAAKGDESQRLLCEIANGSLASARARVAALKDTPDSKELVNLLIAIALKDGASFDHLMAEIPEPDRTRLASRCMAILGNTNPSGFFQLLTESREISQRGFGTKIDDVVQVMRNEPDLFLDLLEQGRCAWPTEPFERLIRRFRPGPEQSLRLLELCGKGEVKIADSNTLEGLMRCLPDDAFAKLQSDFGTSALADALAQEAWNRAFFADFPTDPLQWQRIGKERLFSGMTQMIEGSGVPSLPWAAMPTDLRQELGGQMLITAVNTQGDAGARTMLNSILQSGLPEEERNQMLEESATRLFNLHGNIRLAIDFAQSITSDAEGRNAGEDLLVKWTAYDPISAKVYIDKSEPSPYRDRLLERVKELTP